SYAEDRLEFHVPAESLERLIERFYHDARRPEAERQSSAEQAVKNWLFAFGPAYCDERRDGVFAQIFDVARRLGLNLEPAHESLKLVWRKAFRQWTRIRRHALQWA